jgi:kindlin 2
MFLFVPLQLPDLRYLDCRVDYSVNTFKSVVSLCKDLGIRYPEELSLCKPLSPEHLKKNFADLPRKKMLVESNGNYQNGREYLQPAPDTNTFIPTHGNSFHGSENSLDDRPFMCAPVSQRPTPPPQHNPQGHTPISSPSGTLRYHTNGFHHSFNDSSSSLGDFIENLAYSPRAPSPEAISKLVRPKTLVERARMNVG